jgi:isopenicillin N synthase-like dioxygenase
MDAVEFEKIYQEVFSPTFTGYSPAIAEAPNGDSRIDLQKRYSHLNHRTLPSARDNVKTFLAEVFSRCMRVALEHARIMNIPYAFMPSAEDSTLRLLEYPPGATSSEHTDFDLFTINLYRSHEDLIVPKMPVHFGELADIVSKGWLKAVPHHVTAHLTQTQRSAVFFVMPALSACLPNGMTVREWVAERKTRSRVQKY